MDELRLQKTDLMQHIKMSSKVKKMKNQNEIAQGQTMILDSGKSNKKGRKR